MVGDSLPLDIAGGHGVGLRTIWVTGPDEKPGGAGDRDPGPIVEPGPDFVVPSVVEAVAVLLGGVPPAAR